MPWSHSCSQMLFALARLKIKQYESKALVNPPRTQGNTNYPCRAQGISTCPIPAHRFALWYISPTEAAWAGTALALHPKEEAPAATKGLAGPQQEQRAQQAPGTPTALQRGSDCRAPPFLVMLLPPRGYGPNVTAEPDIQMATEKATTQLPCRALSLVSKKHTSFDVSKKQRQTVLVLTVQLL